MTYWAKVAFVYLILAVLSAGLYVVTGLKVFGFSPLCLADLFFIPCGLALACIYFHLGDPAGAGPDTSIILMGVFLLGGCVLFAGAFAGQVYLFSLGIGGPTDLGMFLLFLQVVSFFFIIIGLLGLCGVQK